MTLFAVGTGTTGALVVGVVTTGPHVVTAVCTVGDADVVVVNVLMVVTAASGEAAGRLSVMHVLVVVVVVLDDGSVMHAAGTAVPLGTGTSD